MAHVQIFTFNPFQENTYVLWDDSREAVIIDPGCYERHEQAELTDFITAEKLTVKYILNTHCHIDHVLGNAFTKTTYGVNLLIHRDDLNTLRSVKVYAPSYGFAAYDEALPEGFVAEGDCVTFGNTSLEVIFVPGHAPGHVGFFDRAAGQLFSGDVLFRESVGRTDLPGGNTQTLMTSIAEKLFTLPDAVVVYPGHGPETTIGYEKIHNPYCAISRL